MLLLFIFFYVSGLLSLLHGLGGPFKPKGLYFSNKSLTQSNITLLCICSDSAVILLLTVYGESGNMLDIRFLSSSSGKNC